MKITLGNFDEGSEPANKAQFLSLYHSGLSEVLQKKQQFRDEANGAWNNFSPVPGTTVRELQQFLKDAGFMPKANVDGIFGYATQAAVRLFQEYVRTIEKDASIGAPDGIVGEGTLGHINKWKRDRPGFVSEWGRATSQNPSEEFRQWISLLAKAKQFYQSNPNPIVEHLNAYQKRTDTRKVRDWDTAAESIHLIGIRSGQEASLARNERRQNDDLFVLLIKGMVFKFWGSTDPNPGMSDRSEIPFLIEGQHNYQFGWHKISDEKTVYRALRPLSTGVLVFRDRNADKALTEADIVKGLDKDPNTTINIHWSGIGNTNFSAGCQVIAGKSYVNDKKELVNCTPFAASSYRDLGGRIGRGAYNVFADLILSYAPAGVRSLVYTLGRDETLFLSETMDEDYVKRTVTEMKSV